MAQQSTPPEALDDTFIGILVEELMPGASCSPGGAGGNDAVAPRRRPRPNGAQQAPPPTKDAAADTGSGTWVEPDAAPEATKPALPEDPLSLLADEPAAAPPAKDDSSATPPDTTRWQIRVVEEGGVEHVVPLGGRPVTIGRLSENLVIVRCPRVSRRHLRIWLDKTGPRVVEVSERGRMLVNGVKMATSHLREKDVIQVGSVKVYVERANQPRGATS